MLRVELLVLERLPQRRQLGLDRLAHLGRQQNAQPHRRALNGQRLFELANRLERLLLGALGRVNVKVHVAQTLLDGADRKGPLGLHVDAFFCNHARNIFELVVGLVLALLGGYLQLALFENQLRPVAPVS